MKNMIEIELKVKCKYKYWKIRIAYKILIFAVEQIQYRHFVYCDLNVKIDKAKKLTYFLQQNQWNQINKDDWTKHNPNGNNSNLDIILWKNNTQ